MPLEGGNRTVLVNEVARRRVKAGEGRRTKGEGSFEGKDWKYTCFSSSFSLSPLSPLALDFDPHTRTFA
jgi:hypothetical protein